jgi:hypothetical protein
MMDKLEIFVYSDSLGLPRARENIDCSMTYPELIRQWYESNRTDKKVYLYNRSVGGGKIHELHYNFQNDCVYFGNFYQRILILHCGIVDCAPRPIPECFRVQLSKLPGKILNPIVNFLHNNRAKILGMGFMWRATPPKRFGLLYKRWLLLALNHFTRVYVFNILPTNTYVENHSPGLSKSIEIYNKIIAEQIKSIDSKNLFFFDVNKRVTNSPAERDSIINRKDGHHITSEGHELFARLVTDNEKLF